MSVFALWLSAALAAPAIRAEAPTEGLMPHVRDAADEFSVPTDLLAAILWEATRLDPNPNTIWHGYGPADLLVDGDPNIDDAALLLGVSPNLVMTDARTNIRGAAALLARQARRQNGGVLPERTDLESWAGAVKIFAKSHDPDRQEMYAAYLYEALWLGIDGPGATGERVRFGRVPVDLPGLFPDRFGPEGGRMTRSAATDSSEADAWVAACSDNYSNYSRTGSDIKYVIIHTVQGSYSGCISWFQNCSASVSAHYVVRSSDGQITQMVKEEDVAWHAGNWTYNEQSVGIEHEGYVESPETWYTDAMYEASAALTADICDRTSAEPDRTHVIGHVEVPGATHTDPGSGWDWSYYMDLVTGGSSGGELTGVVADTDIYDSEKRLPGVTVWIAETGATTTTDETGTYLFEELPPGTYTVHADAEGYLEGTCTKDVADSSTYWCSIALLPGEDEPQDTDTDTDTEPPGDTGEPPVEEQQLGSGGPGDRVAGSELGAGCACNGGYAGMAPGAGLLIVSLLARRRRK